MTTSGQDDTDPNCKISKDIYVKLISSDGHEFYIKRDLAVVSPIIKLMLSRPGQCAENQIDILHFRNISSEALVCLCSYFAYKVRYTNSSIDIPEFPIPAELVLEIMKASDFLDC